MPYVSILFFNKLTLPTESTKSDKVCASSASFAYLATIRSN